MTEKKAREDTEEALLRMMEEGPGGARRGIEFMAGCGTMWLDSRTRWPR